jgi:hypothetical protein
MHALKPLKLKHYTQILNYQKLLTKTIDIWLLMLIFSIPKSIDQKYMLGNYRTKKARKLDLRASMYSAAVL